MKPEFICIGAQKAGTTWLHENLQRHPEFSMPPVKELHYFDRSPDYLSADHLSVTRFRDRWKDLAWRRKMLGDIWRPLRSLKLGKARWWVRFHLSDFDDEWYRSLFSGCRGISGDVTPSYSVLDEEDVLRMHQAVPDAKLIFLIRDPVERAWSMLRFHEQFGKPLDMNNLEGFKERIDDPTQDRRSDYLRTIDLFQRFYPRDQILVGFFDAIREDPAGLLRSVCRYVGADEGLIADESLAKAFNKSKRQDSCPPEFRDYLKHKYRPMVTALAERFGGYPGRWLDGWDGKEADVDGCPAPVVWADGQPFP